MSTTSAPPSLTHPTPLHPLTTTSPDTTTSSSSSSKPKSFSQSTTASTATDRQIAEARAALEASMHNIGSHFDATLKSRATNLHANNGVLDKQIAELQGSTKALGKETDKLKRVADDAARKLKEVGNVQNWAEVMEREFLILEETVRLAGASDEEEDYGPCRVCGVRVEESGEHLLWCRGCDGEFHVACVGLESVPGGEWWCAECEEVGTYLQSVRVPEVAMDGVAGAAEHGLKGEEVVSGVGNGIGPGNGPGNGPGDGTGNDPDVEMGGMEDRGKGKGKERAVERPVEGRLSTTIAGEGSSMDHSSTMNHSSSVDHSSAMDLSPATNHPSTMYHPSAATNHPTTLPEE